MAALSSPLPPRAVALAPRRPLEDVAPGRRAPSRPLVGINAYHQPGVEAGKKAAATVLALQGRILAELRRQKGEHRTAEKIAAALGEGDVETVFAVLRHLAANPDHAVARRDGPTFFLATFGSS